MSIKEMVKISGITIDEAFEKFYNSDTIKYLQDKETLYFTYSPTALAYVCLQEQVVRKLSTSTPGGNRNYQVQVLH
jgi:hypothetical protein